MAHLGDDVAAFVDGQLSGPVMRDAAAHVESCDDCGRAVRQQRLLKSRMNTVETPPVSADLMASLSSLAEAPPPDDRWWSRVRRSAPFRAGVVVAGASMSVAAVAWVVGGAAVGGIGDRVAPPFDQYAAGFFAGTSVATAASVSDDRVEELARHGWSCHPRLAGDLERTAAAFAPTADTIALTYTNGTTRLKLFEQAGRLDREAVDGFEERVWGDATVWVRAGQPTVVTWDEGGVVYTMVTDADSARIREAVADLPTSDGRRHPAARIGDGLQRMTSWFSAA